jgi:NADH-quinone oxidoreductase subunit E
MNVTQRLKNFTPHKDNLLLILHDVQNHNPRQYLPLKNLKAVAEYLNIPLSAVYSVASYYSMFSLKPRGKYLIRICKSPVCRMMGSYPLIDILKQKLGIEIGQTTSDGEFTLEVSECQGKCEMAPSMLINEQHYKRLTVDRLEKILNSLRVKNSD